MFSRSILHHGADPGSEPQEISSRTTAGCWFELHRQGGCGAGEVALKDGFGGRGAIEIGDWISFEAEPGVRWYLGRVEERSAASPAGVRLRLEGMGIELNEVFPGGFAADADNVPPHRFGRTDLFANDPDYAMETFDAAPDASDLVRLLLQRYVAPATHIQHVASLIESPADPAGVESLKFRGEESARSIIKQLALVARGASWGVNAAGEFFFLRRRNSTLTVLREGRDLVSLEESRDRELLFNRLLLTGDYVYDVGESGWIARRAYRFRATYVQPESRALHGERRIRLWIPWIRTGADALLFAREFFRTYAHPTSRYVIETTAAAGLLAPWEGRVRLEDRGGGVIATSQVESVRVLFDHVPRLRLELGPADPRTLWPEPPEDERWELPNLPQGGRRVSLTEDSSSGSSGGSGSLSSAGSGASTGSLSLSGALSTGSGGGPSGDSSLSSDGSSGQTHSQSSGGASSVLSSGGTYGGSGGGGPQTGGGGSMSGSWSGSSDVSSGGGSSAATSSGGGSSSASSSNGGGAGGGSASGGSSGGVSSSGASDTASGSSDSSSSGSGGSFTDA